MSNETIKKGWLLTREDQKFAPITLVENVMTRSGKLYDERVREYIASLNNKLTQDINDFKEQTGNDVSQKIAALEAQDTVFENQLKYFDGSASDKLFIVDNQDNVVAYIDGTGVHAIDFIDKNNDSFSLMAAAIKQMQAQLQWFDGSSSEAFFFIDNSNNVVAYIDGNGIHSTEYIHQDGTTFSWVLDKVKAFDNELQWFEPNGSSEAFFFIDNSADNNVAAKIAGDGIDAVDFRAKGQKHSLVGLNVQVDSNKAEIDVNTQDISSLKTRTEEVEQKASTLEDRADTLEQNLEDYYGYNNFGDAFYFIDNQSSPEVVTMVNAAGITTIDVTFKNGKSATKNMMFFEKLGTINITI